MQKFLFILLSLVLSGSIYAAPLNGGCVGIHKGKKLIFKGTLRNSFNFNSGDGALYYDNRLLARFSGPDLKVNLLFQSFKLANGQGDIIEGKATNLSQMKAMITRLSVPAYGMRIVNLPVSCWSN